MHSQYLNDWAKQARAAATERQEAAAKFRQLILASLTHCQEAAESDRENHMKLARNAVRIKNEKAGLKEHEQFPLSEAGATAAERMLEGARNECQQTCDMQLKNGK